MQSHSTFQSLLFLDAHLLKQVFAELLRIAHQTALEIDLHLSAVEDGLAVQLLLHLHLVVAEVMLGGNEDADHFLQVLQLQILAYIQ
jgi:hypothetical protein